MWSSYLVRTKRHSASSIGRSITAKAISDNHEQRRSRLVLAHNIELSALLTKEYATCSDAHR